MDKGINDIDNAVEVLQTQINDTNTVISDKIKVKPTPFTATANGIINIPHSLTYDPTHDVLKVVFETCTLEKDEHYTENADNFGITLKDWSLRTGDKVYFEVDRYVK